MFESSSISKSLSKDSVYESMGLSITDAALADAVRNERESISNESICKGDEFLDTYTVTSDAIKGGMGSVWQVHHRGWNIDLAMKRPLPRFFSEGSERRKENFIRECESWINLGLHPNIVSCYYVREIGGIPSIFSEWMDNGSLGDRIRDGSLYEGAEEEIRDRLLDIAIQFARGLRYAHENGLIHQDVKPDNLLLTKAWDAKVADFGLAHARSFFIDEQGDETAQTQMTPTGGYTPAYCSPEQAEEKKLTKRTDIYSWALSVLEMYSGNRPWRKGFSVSTGHSSEPVLKRPQTIFNRLFSHKKEPEDSETVIDAYKFISLCRIPVPEQLQLLLLKCLSYNPECRPHDMAEVELSLINLYKELSGRDYLRSQPKSARDTPDSLNNRALSFLDIGQKEEAKRLLFEAVQKNSSLLYRYNYSVLRWQSHEISDKQLRAELLPYDDGSELYRRIAETLKRMQGEDPEKCQYNYQCWHQNKWLSPEQARPEHYPPLLPLSTVSVDGRYIVEGYYEHESLLPDHYGYRIRDTVTQEVKTFENTYDDYGFSDPKDGTVYLHAHYYKSKDVCFAGPKSEFIVMQADVLWIFNAHTGDLICSLAPVLVEEDTGAYASPGSMADTGAYTVHGYTSDGALEYSNSAERGAWVHGFYPDVSARLHYELAKIASTEERLAVESEADKHYRLARMLLEQNHDAVAAYLELKQSLLEHTLTAHAPSLALWHELGSHLEKSQLVSVVETELASSPLPNRMPRYEKPFCQCEDNRNKSENGQTTLILNIESEELWDSCQDMYEYTFFYSLSAKDSLSGKLYFEVKSLEKAEEADWMPFCKDRWLGLLGENTLLYAQNGKEPESIDLGSIDWQIAHELSFAIPCGEKLQNTKSGVDIGGFVFADSFDDFYPIYNSDIIRCKNKTYQLIYRYKLPEPWKTELGEED